MLKKILRTESNIGSNTVDLIFTESDAVEVVARGHGYEIVAETGTPDLQSGIAAVEMDLDRLNLDDIRQTLPSEYFAAIDNFFHQD